MQEALGLDADDNSCSVSGACSDSAVFLQSFASVKKQIKKHHQQSAKDMHESLESFGTVSQGQSADIEAPSFLQTDLLTNTSTSESEVGFNPLSRSASGSVLVETTSDEEQQQELTSEDVMQDIVEAFRDVSSNGSAVDVQRKEETSAVFEQILDHPVAVIMVWIALPILGALVGFVVVASCCDRDGRMLRAIATVIGVRSAPSDPELQEALQLSSDESTGRFKALLASASTCTAAELKEILTSEEGYDLSFSKPSSTKKPVRLLARVDGFLGKCPTLTSPLTQRECVFYNAEVNHQSSKGPHVLVSSSATGTFEVSLVDDQSIRVEIRGSEIQLFEMQDYSCTAQQPFAVAPEHWKEFVYSHQKATSSRTSRASDLKKPDLSSFFCEFKEQVLPVGSQVLIVGEVTRDSSGNLSMQPCRKSQAKSSESAERTESWRTSWELLGCKGHPRTRAEIKKVLITSERPEQESHV